LQYKVKDAISRLVPAIWPVTDYALFLIAYGCGAPVVSAHIFGFAVASAVVRLRGTRSAPTVADRPWDLRLHAQLFAMIFVAVSLRGGVLALFMQSLGWTPVYAMIPAVLASHSFSHAASSFGISLRGWKMGIGTGTHQITLALVGTALVLRLVYLGQTELLPEEAYYWNYSRHLDIAYVDHPPMVAWLIRAGTAVFGDTALGVRAGSFACNLVASFFTYRLARDVFGVASARVAVLFIQVLPFSFLAGMWMTPEAPLVAAWAASLYYLQRSLVAGQAEAWWGVGLSIGLGLLSGMTIGLLVIAGMVFALFDPWARRWWRCRHPYAAAAVAAAIFSPVIMWNAARHWVSFESQTSGRLAEGPEFSLQKLIADVLILITPLGGMSLFTIAFGPSADTPSDRGVLRIARQRRFLRISIFVPLSILAAFSLRHDVKLDWAGAPLIAAIPFFAECIATVKSGRVAMWLARAWRATLALMLALYAVGLHYLVLGVPGVADPVETQLLPLGWRDLGRQVAGVKEAIRQVDGVEPLVVGMDPYMLASELAFYSPDPRRAARSTSSAHLFSGAGLMYELWFPARLQNGKTLLLVAWNPEDLCSPGIAWHVSDAGPVFFGLVSRGSGTVRPFYLRVVSAYHASQLID
jgi:dolichol-phosphate mannosyltransferase